MAYHPTQTGSDFNIRQLADIDISAPANLRVNDPQADMDAERVRRAIAELDSICNTLTGDEQYKLRARIDNIQTQLASGVNPVQLMNLVAAVRTEAQSYQQSQGNGSNGVSEGDRMALSAEAQARVNARLGALQSGDVVSYYTNSIANPHLDAETAKWVGQQLEKDPEIKKAADVASRQPEKHQRRAEEDIERDKEWLKEKLGQEKDPEMQTALKLTQKLGLMYNGERAENLRAAYEAGNHKAVLKLVDEGLTDRSKRFDQELANAGNGSAIRLSLEKNPKFLSDDGYTLDSKKIVSYVALNEEKVADAMRRMRANEALGDEDRALANAGILVETGKMKSAQYHQSTRVMKCMAQEHSQEFSKIVDASLPKEERAEMLRELLLKEKGKGNYAQMAEDARYYIDQMDSNQGRFKDYILGKAKDMDQSAWTRAHSEYRMRDGLQDLGYTETQVTQLMQVAEKSPAMLAALDRQFTTGQPSAVLKTALDNVLSGGSPENKNTLSVLSYYKIDCSYEGQMLLEDVYTNRIEPQEAAARVAELRDAVVARMGETGVAKMAASFMEDRYLDRLRGMEGMTKADGSLDIAAIMEKARTHRDVLGPMTDEQMRERTLKPFEQLSDADKDMRAVHRTAAHFRAVDMVQEFGRDIEAAYMRLAHSVKGPEAVSLELRQDRALYAKMVDASKPEEQKEAIQEFLSKNEQYYRTTPALRAELAEFIASISAESPTLLHRQFLAMVPDESKSLAYNDIKGSVADAAKAALLAKSGYQAPATAVSAGVDFPPGDAVAPNGPQANNHTQAHGASVRA